MPGYCSLIGIGVVVLLAGVSHGIVLVWLSALDMLLLVLGRILTCHCTMLMAGCLVRIVRVISGCVGTKAVPIPVVPWMILSVIVLSVVVPLNRRLFHCSIGKSTRCVMCAWPLERVV